jgi:hypothetical protein
MNNIDKTHLHYKAFNPFRFIVRLKHQGNTIISLSWYFTIGHKNKGNIRISRLAAASDKVYQLLAQGRWFSPGTPASSTTKTGRHDIAEILLKVALNFQICFSLWWYVILKGLFCPFAFQKINLTFNKFKFLYYFHIFTTNFSCSYWLIFSCWFK